MSTTETIIVQRTKAWSVMELIIGVPMLIGFTVVGIIGLISADSVGAVLFCIFILVVCMFMAKKVMDLLPKMTSPGPELEITKDALIVFDNPDYSRIMLSEVKDCKIYSASKVTLLGLHLKDSSTLRRNIGAYQQFVYGIPDENKNTIFLNLETADIHADKLAKIINERIDALKEKITT